MNKKLISVVLPVYNGEKYISESITSIINQTYTNWELIIVNDCSTDNTLDIVKSFADKDSRIRVINNDINRKLPASLNIGFANTNGYFLTWTSDDNVYKQDAFIIMKDYLEKHNDVSFVYANYTKIDELGNNLKEIELGKPKYIFKRNVCGACFLYTRDIYQKVGNYDVNSYLAEDYDYWLRIKAKGNINHINDNLYYYRAHSKSLTKTRKNEIRLQTLQVLLKNRNDLVDKCVKIEKCWLNDQIIKYAEESKKKYYMESFFKEDHFYLIYSKINKVFNRK